MRNRWLSLALVAGLSLGFLAKHPAAQAQEKPADALAGKKVRLNLKNVSVIDAVDELVRQSGYSIQIQGDAANLVKRKVTLDTGETTFWKAFDQLCAKGDLVEVAAAGRPDQPGALPGRPGRPGGIRPLPLPIVPPGRPGAIQPDAFEALQKALGGLIPNDLAPPGGMGGIGGIGGLPLLPENLPDIDPEALQKLEGDLQQNLQQILQIARMQLQLVNPQQKKKPGQPNNPFAELQQLQEMQKKMNQLLDQMLQIRPGQARFPALVPGPAPMEPEAVAGALNVKDGKAPQVPTAYAGAARVRLLPLRREGDQALYAVEVSLEPRVQAFTLGEGSRVERAADARGEAIPAALILPGQQRGAAAQPVVQVKLTDKEARTLKELRGHIAGQVLAPGEPLIVVDDVFNAGGKNFKGPRGATISVQSVEKRGEAEVVVKLRLETPPVAGDGLRPAGLPALVDAKGEAYQLAQVPSRATRRTGAQTVSQDLTLVYRANPGQGDAARLVLNSLQPVNVRLPFELENVPLP